MAVSVRNGCARVPLAPLAALFALAVLAIAWVAQSSICTRPIVFPAAAGAMSGMDMAAPHDAVMICPVVLALIVISAVLAAWTLVAARRDTQRALTSALLVRALARLPVMRTFAVLAGGGGVAVGSIVAIDGHGPIGLALCASLAAMSAAVALAATLGALVIARAILECARRLFVALFVAIAERQPGRAIAAARRRPLLRPLVRSLSGGRGLRAPPFPAH